MDQLTDNLKRCQLAEEPNGAGKMSNKTQGIRMNNSNSRQLKQSNNNEEDYANNYSSSPVEDGRVSGGSEESAFSTSSADSPSFSLVTSNSSHDDSTSGGSSGRSSASRDESGPIDEVKKLNPYCNIMPEQLECLEIIERVRVKTLATLAEDEEIDAVDMEQMRQPLVKLGQHEQQLAFRLISRFVNFHALTAKQFSQVAVDKEVSEAAEKVKDLLKFRHQTQLNTTLADTFIREFYQLSGIFQFGVDKNNVPVLYLRARVHRKWSPKFDESFKHYIAYHVNKATKSYPGAQVEKAIGDKQIDKDGSFAICFDCLHVSYSCLDIDSLRYIVKLLVQLYPTYCRYALCVDLPWLFRSVWKLVQTWLPEDARNLVHLISSKQLVDYIEPDQIPNSMKINDLKASEKPIEQRHRLPKNLDSFKSIDDLAEEANLSASEVKQFKKHVEEVIKEYELLGAM